jgi:hypothetical protein
MIYGYRLCRRRLPRSLRSAAQSVHGLSDDSEEFDETRSGTDHRVTREPEGERGTDADCFRHRAAPQQINQQ